MNLMFAFFLSIAPWFAEGWETAWSLFYAPQTHLFYDYISSYETGKSLHHLPTLEEMSLNIPIHADIVPVWKIVRFSMERCWEP